MPVEYRYRLAEPDFREDEIALVGEVLRSGWLIQGLHVAEFEQQLGQITASDAHVAVASGTAALHLAMLALGIAPGDLVYIPSLAWPSAANVALLLGALPVFVDVRHEDGNIDPHELSRRIEESISRNLGRPSLVIPVHAFGLPCDIDAIMPIAAKYGLSVLEDAACSLGAMGKDGTSVGLFGDMGIFSFHPRKSLTTGEGGSIVSKDASLLAACRRLRDHGRSSPLKFDGPGLNYRLTEFQGALGAAQARRFRETVDRRRELAGRYLTGLRSVSGIALPPDDPRHTWQTFFVTLESGQEAAALRTALGEAGIESGFPSHSAQSLEPFAGLPGAQRMAVSEELRDCGVTLPLHVRMSNADVANIASAIRTLVTTKRKPAQPMAALGSS